MVQNDIESINELLKGLEKNKFVKSVMQNWHDLARVRMRTSLILVFAVLGTMLLLNLIGKLSIESNGWILAALIGYLFGRGTQISGA